MSKKSIILCLFIVFKFVLQYFAIDSGYELHRDEFLHLDLGKHLAWGYASVPPITGWISFIILLLGNSVFLVKFVPALFGALTIIVVWKTIEELGGQLFALVLGAIAVSFSVLIRINTLYQPNSLEFLLWTTVFFAIIKFINSKNNKWIWIAALTFAVGFLNKYNITFLMLGLIPAFLITKHRSILLNKHLYFSLFVALALVTPNLIWQYNNDFPVFQHLKTLADTQLVNVNRVDFLKEQVLFFIGSFYVLILAFIAFFKHAPFRKFQLFFWSYLCTITLFIFFKAKGYYAIGLYPILLAFGAVYLEKLLEKGWLRYLKIPSLLIPILIMTPIFQIALPVLKPSQIIEKSDAFESLGLLRWEDGKNHAIPQDFADMLGWRELASLVDQAFDSIDAKENTLIQCDNYGQAGAINFYAQQQFTEAVSMNADYINWYPFDNMEIQNVILVQESSDTDRNREREKSLFEKITFIGKIENKYAREVGTSVYVLQGAKQSINAILKQEIQARKNSH